MFQQENINGTVVVKSNFHFQSPESQGAGGALRGCLSKILITILDHITDFLETLLVSYTL